MTKREGTAINASSTGTLAAQQLRYFQQDHLGSTAIVTDEAGAVVERMAYDPWGCSGKSKMQLLASCPAKRLSACKRDGYQRRFANGLADSTDSLVGQATHRGYTEFVYPR